MTPVRFRHLPLTLAACVLLLAACASPGDGAQTIFVRTHQADGELVPGVPCVLTNKAGQWHVTAPGEVAVRRDASPLWVSCGSDSWEMASQAAQDAQGDRRSSMAKGAKMGLGIGALVGLVAPITLPFAGPMIGLSVVAGGTTGALYGGAAGAAIDLGGGAAFDYAPSMNVALKPREAKPAAAPAPGGASSPQPEPAAAGASQATTAQAPSRTAG
ncbi:MAG: hypothetical protein E6Q92_02080 [Burkholderiaceae bacterium]|nr:MAG: hypothetical protein E6Q92_02080 [Burkholderiaceae bacterium]